MVFEEGDEKFWLGVGTSRDEKWLVIGTASKLTSEVRLLDAATPTGEFSVVAPRRFGVEYDVEVASDRLLILHNDGAENFELASAPLPGSGDTSAWTTVIAHRADTRLLSVDAFESCLMLYYRRDGMTGLSVLPPSGVGEERPITFPEPLYTVGLGANPEYTQTRFRIGYNSMVTPSTVYDYDIADGSLTQLKQQPVLASPAGVPFSSADYEQFREWAVAPDGTRVPISIVCRQGHAARRVRALPDLRVRQLRALDRPRFLDHPAVAARPRLRLRDRARPRRRRDGTAVVRPREDAGEEEHVHRLRRLRAAPGIRRAGRPRPGWWRAAGRRAGC